MILAGNGSQAVRDTDGDYLAPDKRSQQILAKTPEQSALEYIDASMQQIGVTAIERVNDLVQSGDESIATRNSHFILDHIKGKAVQKSVNLTAKINVQSVLD